VLKEVEQEGELEEEEEGEGELDQDQCMEECMEVQLWIVPLVP